MQREMWHALHWLHVLVCMRMRGSAARHVRHARYVRHVHVQHVQHVHVQHVQHVHVHVQVAAREPVHACARDVYVRVHVHVHAYVHGRMRMYS